jgi:hypothetical protein
MFPIFNHSVIYLYLIKSIYEYNSHTYKCVPEMHLINLLKSLGIKGSSLVISQTSRTSTSSVRNMTSLTELPKVQYLKSPSTNYFY